MRLFKIALLMLSFSLFASNNSGRWHLVRQVNGVESWRYQGNGQVSGQRQMVEPTSPTEWQTVTVDDFLAQQQAKKHVLGLIGVHDWKINHHTLIREKQQGIFRLSGTYQDHKKQTIYFLEVHYLRPTNNIQLLYTAPISWTNHQLLGEEFISYASQKDP